MAQQSVEQGVSIRLACLTFGISQTCFRYQAKQSAENGEIADLLIRLTHNQRLKSKLNLDAQETDFVIDTFQNIIAFLERKGNLGIASE